MLPKHKQPKQSKKWRNYKRIKEQVKKTMFQTVPTKDFRFDTQPQAPVATFCRL